MIQKEKKTAIIAEYATHEGDTGSPEVQIAILTARINELTEHLREHKHDNHSLPLGNHKSILQVHDFLFCGKENVLMGFF